MNMKYFIFKHFEKFIFGIAVGYLIYTVISVLITERLKTQNIDSQLRSLSTMLDRKLATSKPPSISADRKEAELLKLRLTTPPAANLCCAHTSSVILYQMGQRRTLQPGIC